ncbi:MAG: LPS export ABC transporter permease LptF [Desulfobacteraceae bacterium]|nr:LPS export ABC transporter permease LptF [Desulfobacteraceae bacterium]
MKRIKIINFYIFKELAYPFGTCLFFLTFVFLMTRIPEITNYVVNYNTGISSVLLMLLYTMPRFLEFTIPMSVMIAVLLTFMHMSGDNEIIALKSAGMSLYKLLPPVLVFCLLCTLFTLWVTVIGVSWGKLSLKKRLIEIASSSIDSQLQERQFNILLDGVMAYISSVDMKTRTMKDIFLEDKRQKGIESVYVAPEGRLIKSEDGKIITIRLLRGMMNRMDLEQQTVNHLKFSTADYNIDLEEELKAKSKINKELDERSLVDLIQFIRSGIDKKDKAHLSIAWMVLHEKFAIPFACLSLGLLAFPLGIQSMSLRKSSGFGMGIFFFLLYYGLLAGGLAVGETGKYPPVVLMWLPNVVMGAAGIYLLKRNAEERPVHMPKIVSKSMIFLRKKIRKKA